MRYVLRPHQRMAPATLVFAWLVVACPIVHQGSVCGIVDHDPPSAYQPSCDDPLPAVPSNRRIMSRGPTDAKCDVEELVATSKLGNSYAAVIHGAVGLLSSRLNADWLDLWSRSPAGGAASWAVACWLGSRRSSRMLLVLLAVIRGAHAQKVSEVRIGGLFPLVDTSVNKVGRLAAFVMAVQEINNSPDLLPNVNLR